MEQEQEQTPDIYCGTITLVEGPMFSGKTTELFRLLRRQKIARKKVLAIKYLKDGKNILSNHNGHGFNDDEEIQTKEYVSLDTNLLADIIENDVEVVGIDEGQFFVGLADACDFLQKNGISVIVAALSGTFERKMWPEMILLKPFVTYCTTLTAICDVCGEEAPYSKKIVNVRLSDGGQLEDIGGKEKYNAVCLKHYFI